MQAIFLQSDVEIPTFAAPQVESASRPVSPFMLPSSVYSPPDGGAGPCEDRRATEDYFSLPVLKQPAGSVSGYRTPSVSRSIRQTSANSPALASPTPAFERYAEVYGQKGIDSACDSAVELCLHRNGRQAGEKKSAMATAMRAWFEATGVDNTIRQLVRQAFGEGDFVWLDAVPLELVQTWQHHFACAQAHLVAGERQQTFGQQGADEVVSIRTHHGREVLFCKFSQVCMPMAVHDYQANMPRRAAIYAAEKVGRSALLQLSGHLMENRGVSTVLLRQRRVAAGITREVEHVVAAVYDGFVQSFFGNQRDVSRYGEAPNRHPLLGTP